MLDDVQLARRRARQRLTVTILALLLIVAGAVILLFLHRLPMPMRIMAGLGDLFVGCVLLVLVRQNAAS
jgi:hypothetical protein